MCHAVAVMFFYLHREQLWHIRLCFIFAYAVSMNIVENAYV